MQDNYQQLNVAGTEQSQMIGGLVANHEYSFHVTACTVIGCSKPTNDVAAIPLDNGEYNYCYVSLGIASSYLLYDKFAFSVMIEN